MNSCVTCREQLRRLEDKLAQGIYGTINKGQLSSEVFVAVKVLNTSKGDGEESINEVGTMGKIHCANVVRMVGFYIVGFRRALLGILDMQMKSEAA
ncbi:Serine-threonine/tyrosine-protein kinase, catalytic domain [Dillenia turbinata]|uniref:Serine-threonine/tyrosine-protein kinase, catalytic domain n=1 Tax=Dillenia turbinata TaxID=194707 RepID=A0AAN8ZGC1_9MAGN